MIDSTMVEKFPEESAAKARMDQLRADGYEILSADDPRSAIKGWVAFKRFDGQEEETCIRVEWPMFGVSLTPRKRTVSGSRLAAFISEGKSPCYRCDDPMARLIGFVRYFPEKCESQIRYMTLTALKGTSEEDKAIIMAARA